MKILIHAVGATTGGGASRTRELARTLPVSGPTNDYLFVLPPHLQADVAQIAPSVSTLVPPRACSRVPLRLGWEHIALPVEAMGFSPDVVFSPFNVAPLHWRKPKPRVAVIVANLAPYSRVVLDMYRGRDRLRLEMLRWLTDRTIARADHVFLLSRQAYTLIDASLLAEKSEVIPMAPPPAPAYANQDGLPAEPYFVVLGEVVRYKGLETVLTAMTHFPSGDAPLLLICGAHTELSYVNRLRRQVAAAGIENRVRMVGPTDHARALAIVAGARACILPSRFENLSRVPIEAMSLGTPVIARDIESYRESCGSAAMYFDGDEQEELAQHMKAILRSAVLRNEWADRGRQHAGSLSPGDATGRILQALHQT